MSFNLDPRHFDNAFQGMNALLELRKATTPEEMGEVATKWDRVLLNKNIVLTVESMIKESEQEDPEEALHMKIILRFLSNAMKGIPGAVAAEKHHLGLLDEAIKAFLFAAPIHAPDVLLKYENHLLSEKGFHRAKWQAKGLEARSGSPHPCSEQWFENEDRRLKIQFLEDRQRGISFDDAALRYVQSLKKVVKNCS